MALKVTSSAFDAGTRIPKKHTCDGEDRSPALAWQGAPAGAKSFALLCDDPDAPGKTWVHWLLYDLPANAQTLEEGIPATPTLPSGARQGINDFGKTGYGGPCPPKGHGDHHYHFKVYALDAPLKLPAGAKKPDVEKAMAGHVLAQGEVIGTYSR
jgi:Raf kinase inhibitor-like YbhB/YbcL family protein